MIIPKVKNLIKDDFSDFTAYQGAVVTRNKTFPIDVFKGGRNLVLKSNEFNKGIVNTGITTSLTSEGYLEVVATAGNGDWFTNWAVTSNGIEDNFSEGDDFTVSLTIQRVSGSGVPTIYIKPGMGYFNMTGNIGNTFSTISYSGKWKKLNGISLHLGWSGAVGTFIIKNWKIEKGNTATDWSPAPEDGYGLDLPNGAYHIQTSGGTNTLKLLNIVQNFGTKPFMSGIEIKNFAEHRMSSFLNRTDQPYEYINPNEYRKISSTGNITQPAPNNSIIWWLSSNAIEEDLDFIASDPSIIDEQSINTKNVIDIVQLPEISREEKQLTILSNDEVIIDDFISFKMSTKGSIYQRNMKYCEVVLVGKHELTSEWINIKRFIASDLVDNGNLQEIDYGDFGVLKSEYDDTTQRTKLTCYDRMLQAQIPYDSEVMDLTYPMTISQVLNRLAIVCKLDLVVNTVNNLYQVIATDLWANQSFTYADVLDHIAQATTSIISIRNNKLEIFNPIENDFTIQGKFNSLKMGETFGKTNIVNVSQEPQHYNKFAPSNALDIPLEERKELAFSNNPILNQDMQTWADRLYLQVKDLEYSTFESSTIGYGIFEVGDMVDIYEANEDVIHRVMITNETFDFKHALTTEIGSNMPMVHKNQYVVETDQARQGQTTYLIVDQLNGVIEALVQKVDDEADKTAQLRIDVDSITSTVSNISNGNLLTNGSGELGFLGWSGGSVAKYVKEILEARTTDLRYLENLRYNIGFVPMYNPMSLSEWDISFYNSGFDVSPIAFIVPNIDHSYRAKVSKFKPFSIDVLEFNDLNRANALTANKVTNFAFTSPMDYVQFTFTPSATTQFVRFKYNRTGISPTDRLNIAEVMFNRGQPKEWQPSPNNASAYSNSVRTQLSNKIEDVVTEVDRVSGDIHNAGVEINARDGVTTFGKKFEVMSGDRTETYMKVTDEGLFVSGNIEAGTVGGFAISDGNLVGTDVSVKPNEITVGGSVFSVEDMENASLLNISSNRTNFGELGQLTQLFVGEKLFLNRFSNGTTNIRVDDISPPNPSGSSIGFASSRYGNIYLTNQPNVSSDTRYKSDIQDIDPLLIEIIGREVKPKQYRTIYDDKLHFGYIAQDVERALYKYCGNDKDKYAMLSKDESYMSLLYGELNVIIEAYNRKRNDELEERIKALEERK